MIAPRWRKALRDLLARPGRSLLTLVALTAGLVQIGVMLNAYALLQPELMNMYGRTRPASATLVVDSVSDALVDSVRAIPGVADAEARPVIVARVRANDEWTPAMLHVVRDFDAQRIDTFKRDRGAWPPGPGDVLLERSALRVAGVQVGDSVTLRIASGEDLRVRVAGTAHAAGMAPAWMEHMVPAFVGLDSRVRGPRTDEVGQIRIVVTHELQEGFIREVADSVRSMLERQGHVVGRVVVPTPGRHPHAAQMEAFLFLLLAFGLLSFALSTVLLVSLVQALMAEQVREIGIMKTLGATRAQIAGVYMAQVGLLALGALLVGVPLGAWGGRAYAGFSAGILNTDVSASPFPWWAVLTVVAAGLVVPLLAAWLPLRRAAGITVREALADEPMPASGTRPRFASFPRPLALSLRTLMLRRTRLALTVGMLAMGGAVFMAALNVAEDWRRSVNDDFARRRYDLMVALSEPRPIDELEAMLAGIPGVVRAEYWPGASPYVIGPAGVPTSTTALVGPGPGTQVVAPAFLSGRWWHDSEPQAAVVNQALLALHPGLGPGDSVRVRLRGRTVAFAITGVVRELAPMPVIYAPRAAVLAATGQSGGVTRSMRVVTLQHSDAAQREAARAIEAACEARGIEVTMVQRMHDARQGILDHLVIILSILTLSSLLVVFVGGLGLTSTLTLGVVQRTREFGVMSAIGATPRMLAALVWAEGLLLGLASWAVACLLTVPISYALEVTCGRIFFKTPLDFYWSPLAAGQWLALVVVLASLSSLPPALRAARLTVREALAQT